MADGCTHMGINCTPSLENGPEPGEGCFQERDHSFYLHLADPAGKFGFFSSRNNHVDQNTRSNSHRVVLSFCGK